MDTDRTVEVEDKRELPFLFDTSFDAERVSQPDPNDEPEAPPEPTYSAAELEDARQAGYQAGHKAALLEAASNIEREILQLLEQIREQFSTVAEVQTQANRQMLQDGAEVAVGVMRKLMPATVAQHGTTEVDAFITDCLQHLIGHPRITVWVSPLHVADIEKRLDALLAECGFEGRFLVEEDDTLGQADCRLEWPGGSAERSVAQVWHEIGELLRSYRGQQAEESASSVDETGESA